MSASHRRLSRFGTARASRSERGFTLIEGLVGVAIAGVLSSVAYPSVEAQVQRARFRNERGDDAMRTWTAPFEDQQTG